MHPRQPRRLITQGSVVILTILSLGLAACGAASSGNNGDIKNIVIGTELPVSGTDAGQALPTQHGVDLAVMQAKLPKGYKITVQHENDEGSSGADPTIGKTNIQTLIQNANVVAVIGPFNSGVAKAEIPLVNEAGLTEISPSNTNPGLTKEQFATANGITFSQLHPAGKPEAYFRVPGTDDVQGKVDAQVAVSPQLHAKNVYVVDDSTTYGKGLASYFTSAFTAGGGTIAGSTEITSDTNNLPSVATTILSKTPDLVFYGGVTGEGGAALKKALGAAGAAQLPLLGGDGIADDAKWPQVATNAFALNTVASTPGPDFSNYANNAAVQTFLADYKSQFGGEAPIPYSLLAYDSTNIVIQAITSLINSGKPVTRANIRVAVAGISYTGLAGSYSFDANGDNSGPKVFSIYAITDTSGAWKFQAQVNG